MAEQKMGYEGLIYYGAAGTTAGTLIPETGDMSITFDIETGDTTTRNADGSIPIETSQTTGRKWSMDFNCLNVPGNAVIAALLAASFTGTPIAFRDKDYVSGKGYDGDVIVSHKSGRPLKGQQTIDFTVRPTKAGGRPIPSLYV